jgi:DNA-binding transcriptional LysR family regulator
MTRRPLPPLGPLPSFEATLRLGSMTRAAEELGRTHGAVSRQIRQLEEALHLPLLERQPGALRPTAAGATLFAAVTQAFATLEGATARLAPPGHDAELRLACGSTFAARWLVPRLPRFYARHPTISVSLVMVRHSYQDARDFDVATSWDRLGYPAPKGRHVHPLAEARLGIIAAPDLPVRHGATLLEAETRLVAETMEAGWAAFAQQSGLVLRTQRDMRFPHLHHCIEACLSGLGIALVETRLVEDHLAAGRLRLVAPPLRFPGGMVAIESRNPRSRAAVRKLVAWLREELAMDEAV